MTNATVATSPRRRRRGSDAVADELLDAALVEFAAHGFEGASTRAIAERAGAHQPQINYHFASKDALWRSAVDRLFGLLNADLRDALAAHPDDGTARFEAALRAFVRFSAARPELHRIMNLEATNDSPRLQWLVRRHVRPQHRALRAAWEGVRRDVLHPRTADDVWRIVIGVGALPFANDPLLRRLEGRQAASRHRVEATADLVVELVLGPPRLSRRRRAR